LRQSTRRIRPSHAGAREQRKQVEVSLTMLTMMSDYRTVLV